jgi:predicted nuclease of predicted toxin-antitoxin system
MARFYADENFDYPTVERLRALGHDVLTVQEAGRRASTDAQVLADATAAGRAVLTHDRDDFKFLHRHNRQHAGIVSCTPDDDRDALAARIHAAVQAAGDLTGKHIRIDLPSVP